MKMELLLPVVSYTHVGISIRLVVLQFVYLNGNVTCVSSLLHNHYR